MARRLEEFAEDREPWERQPGETATQFNRFRAYLDAGPERRISKTADDLGIARGTCHQLSSLMRWRERAELYDAEQLRIRRARRAISAEQFRDIEARMATLMLREVGRGIEALAGTPIAAEQVPRWIEAASKVGRLAFGEPSEMVSVTSPGDAPVRVEHVDAAIAEMTPEQRRRLAAELAETVRRRIADERDAASAAAEGDPGAEGRA